MELEKTATALHQLLPAGKAWEWPENGTGDAVLKAMATELVRCGNEAEALPDEAIALHQPPTRDWSAAGWLKYLAANGVTASVNDRYAAFECGVSQAGDSLNYAPMHCVITIQILDGSDKSVVQELADAYKQLHTQIEVLNA